MSNPQGSGGLTPGQFGVSSGGSVPAKQTHTQANVTQTLQDGFTSNQFAGLGGGLISMIISIASGLIGAILGGFTSILDAIFGTVNDQYIAQLPTITDHSQSITTLEAAFNTLLLQGTAITYVSNGTYTPPDGLVALEVVAMIGAGAGGGGGSYDIVNSGTQSGGGGGGGGETHTLIPASVLPTSGGHFSSIAIVVGLGGAGATGDGLSGTGGGDTTIGPIGGPVWLVGGGGNGGSWGNPQGASASLGGAGMIPGGNGGVGGYLGPGAVAVHSTNGGNSTSAYDLHGGGGGGGAGGGSSWTGTSGGTGGIFAGGNPANPGQVGTPRSTVVATGGGGGGGGLSGKISGGAGAAPGGGGGGASVTTGGGIATAAGANGIIFLIEHLN